MKGARRSLLAGRGKKPLDGMSIRRAINTFRGMEPDVEARYGEDRPTAFVVSVDANGDHFGEVIFGPDIYPGTSVVDANATLSLDAAAAHELTHYHRWRDNSALQSANDEHLDEALTSLQAIQRYRTKLRDNDVLQLVADAAARVQLFIEERDAGRDITRPDLGEHRSDE